MRHTMHAARSGACLLQAARPRAALAEVAAALRRPAARQRLLLTPVTAGYQQPLNSQQRKAKRAEAQRLGRSICMVNLGQQGLTPQFLEGFRLAIAANELVKVRVGACDDTLEEVAEALAAAGDCVLVHSIGFTLTFYRQAGLPPPPAGRAAPRAAQAPAAAAAAAAGGSAAEAGSWDEGDEGAAGEDAEEIDEELAAYLLENEDAFSDSDSEGEEAVQPAAGRRKPPPPEFTVIS